MYGPVLVDNLHNWLRRGVPDVTAHHGEWEEVMRLLNQCIGVGAGVCLDVLCVDSLHHGECVPPVCFLMDRSCVRGFLFWGI